MIIKKLREEIIGYLEDPSNLQGGSAEILYIPETEDEVTRVLEECAASKTPLTVSGGGTGTVGARIALGGAVLSTEKLNKIVSVDSGKKRAVLQAGVTIDGFLKDLQGRDLFYPPFPTERTAFIGGNVSTNASGEYSYRFGCTRNYVRAIKAALSTGETIGIERGIYLADKDGYIHTPYFEIRIPSYASPQVKNSAGYFSRPGMDLIDLFIGSEGTLGIITEIETEIIPALPPCFIMIAFFPDETRLLELLGEIKSGKRVNPLSVEYFDRSSLEFLKKDFVNIPECASAIYIEDAATEDNLNSWVELISKYEISDSWMSKDEKSYRNLIDFRHKLPENINEYFREIKSTKLAIDAAVPDNAFADLFELYASVQKETDIQTVRFGHIGENHIHFNFFPKDEKEKGSALGIYEDIIKKVVSAGGTVSAEHGTGKIKHRYLEMMYGKKGIMEMARVKKEIDSLCILGLDNIFPKELLKK